MELFEVENMQVASYKIPGGKLVKVKLSIASGKIDQVRILGDFFLHPEETIRTIEDSLIGFQEDKNSIEKAITQVLKDSDATLIGATAADFSNTIMMAWKSK